MLYYWSLVDATAVSSSSLSESSAPLFAAAGAFCPLPFGNTTAPLFLFFFFFLFFFLPGAGEDGCDDDAEPAFSVCSGVGSASGFGKPNDSASTIFHKYIVEQIDEVDVQDEPRCTPKMSLTSLGPAGPSGIVDGILGNRRPKKSAPATGATSTGYCKRTQSGP